MYILYHYSLIFSIPFDAYVDIFSSNPEKAKEFANIVMANHPELRGFGEIFEKILNNLNKEENEEKNKEE